MSDATVDVLNHPAVKYVHGDINGDVYLEKLVNLVNESENAIARGESEIPESLSQGDLYRAFEISYYKVIKHYYGPTSFFIIIFILFDPLMTSVQGISRCYSRSHWRCM